MRRRVLSSLFVTIAIAGCFGSMDSNMRPAVIPKLSELPDDKRDAILDQSGNTAGPEQQQQQQRTLSRKQKKAVTAAAFAAAIIGQAFSKTQNVTLGTATNIDENSMFQKSHPRRPFVGTGTGSGSGSGSAAGSASASAGSDTDGTSAGQLLPWIKLGAGSGSAN